MALVNLSTFLLFSETVKHPSPITVLIPFRKTTTYHRLSPAKSTSSPQTSAPTSPTVAPSPDPSEIPVPFRDILTPRVLIAAGNYASFALLDVAFRAIHPLFLSTPLSLGGLGFPPSTIGTILFFYGALNGPFQFLCFARLHDRWGSKRTFLIAVWAAVPAFGLFPVISRVAKVYHTGGQQACFAGGGGSESGCYGPLVWVLVAVQVGLSIVMNMAYGLSFHPTMGENCELILPHSIRVHLHRKSFPEPSISRRDERTESGEARHSRWAEFFSSDLSIFTLQMLVSVTKAIGPALSTSLFSFSMQKGYLDGDLVYYIMLALTAMGCMLGSLLPAHRDVSTRHR